MLLLVAAIISPWLLLPSITYFDLCENERPNQARPLSRQADTSRDMKSHFERSRCPWFIFPDSLEPGYVVFAQGPQYQP